MRLIRSVSRPSNTSLLRQFQQCQANKNSSVRLDPVLIEASNLTNGSNILCHGRSFVASASSDAMEARKPQRRLSKDERKSILENYVKKYRETNGGKFPTCKDAMKDVGGGYYLVRLILQELIHNSKQPSEDTTEFSLEKSASKKDEISTNIGEVSLTRELGEVIEPISKEDVRNSNSKVFESKQEQQSLVSVETDEPKDVGTQSDHLIGKLESSLHRDPENNVKQEKLENKLKFDGLEPKSVPQDSTEDDGTQSDHLIGKLESSLHPVPENNVKQEKLENKLKFDGLEPKAGPQESTEASRREHQKVASGDAEPQEKPSVWNNLKSMANGFLSLWKRS